MRILSIIPPMTQPMLGSAPIVVAQRSGPAAKNIAPAVATAAGPKRGEVIDYVEINASPVGVGFAAWNLAQSDAERPVL